MHAHRKLKGKIQNRRKKSTKQMQKEEAVHEIHAAHIQRSNERTNDTTLSYMCTLYILMCIDRESESALSA